MLTREALIQQYNERSRAYYRRGDGTPTRHATNIELATRPLRSQSSAGSFGLEDLRRYRDQLIDRGLQRRTINQWVGWVRGMFGWAAREGMISPRIAAELALLEPLRFGRSSAKEPGDGVIVTLDMVVGILPELTPVLRRMISVQWLTGMRPGELCWMRWSELTHLDAVTIYRPGQHKTKHHNRSRVVVLVPQVVAIIESQPRSPEWVWLNTQGRRYTTHTYGQAVARACDRAGATRWRPGKIRRSTATYARREADAETVQRLLGHACAETTEWYFDLDLVDAIQAA